MPVSAKSLARRGLISDRVMKLHASKSHSQPSKMAKFDAKRRDEGEDDNRGVLPKRQINSPATQDKGGTWGTKGRGPPSKGGRAGPEGQLGVNEIGNKARQQPKFPKGGTAKGKYTKPGAIKGTKSQSTGVVYNDPSRN
jgi:hypothetical protein